MSIEVAILVPSPLLISSDAYHSWIALQIQLNDVDIRVAMSVVWMVKLVPCCVFYLPSF